MSADYRSFFSGKKITVMGLGLLGRGVGDVEFLAQMGASLIVTDLKSEADLTTSLERLKKFPNIEFVLGKHRAEDFKNRDMIIKAAGVPLGSPYLKTDAPIYMSTALFAKFAPAALIAVTGTRGKSTVSQMIYEALAASGAKVHLGGNIKGKSTLAMLPEVKAGDVAVLELDSWQLQGFRDLKISPHIAVFTNLMPDHMNYYKDDMNSYFHDKAAIFENQSAGDVLIAGKEIAAHIKALSPVGRGLGEGHKKIETSSGYNAPHPERPSGIPTSPHGGEVKIAGAQSKIIIPESLPQDWKLSIPGAHNRENAALAREALRAHGMDDAKIKCVLEKFSALEGRLSLSREINGVKIYNDTNATTPEATLAALQSFEQGRVLLIAGGADKNLDLGALPGAIREYCRAAAFLDGTGTKRLAGILPGYPVFSGLKDAFYHIMSLAKSGDAVLLSPAFASFGMFKNEYDRGEQFENLVKAYKP